MTRVLLIRHAETAWNRDRRWQGHADVPLSAEGQRQASALAERLVRAEREIDVLVSSDLSRAIDTARHVGSALGLTPRLEAAWREMDVGRWSGLSRAEIQEHFTDEWQRILAGEDLPRGGGETFSGFTLRIVAALDGIGRSEPRRTIAVVTHGGVIRALRLYIRGLPYERLRELGPVENTELAELWSTDGRWCEASADAA